MKIHIADKIADAFSNFCRHYQKSVGMPTSPTLKIDTADNITLFIHIVYVFLHNIDRQWPQKHLGPTLPHLKKKKLNSFS